MKAQGGGVILNASSFAALDPNAGRATYSAAKAAVKNLSASMAAEFAAANIRVLAYVPGMIATEIAAESIEKYGDALCWRTSRAAASVRRRTWERYWCFWPRMPQAT